MDTNRMVGYPKMKSSRKGSKKIKGIGQHYTPKLDMSEEEKEAHLEKMYNYVYGVPEKGETKMNERLEKKISKWEGRIETISFYSYEEEKIIDYIEEFVEDLKEMDVLDKPEKAKVSKEDAKEIERYKENDWALTHLLDAVGESAQHEELLARAWLDGYEVAEEKKYYVSSAKEETGFWFLSKNNDGEVIVGTNSDYFEADWGALKLTEQEIKDYDKRYLPFMIPVEELK